MGPMALCGTCPGAVTVGLAVEIVATPVFSPLLLLFVML